MFVCRGDYDGRRPIHVAAASGNIEMLDYLIDTCKADCNVIDNFGGTPLLDAAKRGHAAAASRIRNAGGELLLQDAGCTMCTLVMGYVLLTGPGAGSSLRVGSILLLSLAPCFSTPGH